jgi:hypothetical protein
VNACVRCMLHAVKNWEPIVDIGLRQWRPTSTYLQVKRKKPARSKREQEPTGVGEPLLANNVHVWIL